MGLGVELYDRNRGVAFRQGLGIFKDRKRHGPSREPTRTHLGSP